MTRFELKGNLLASDETSAIDMCPVGRERPVQDNQQRPTQFGAAVMRSFVRGASAVLTSIPDYRKPELAPKRIVE